MSDKKMLRDDLGNRMKTFYEQIPKTKLMRHCPVICRIDRKSFHTFTRRFTRPFDDVLIKTIQETTKYLCENVQGCVLGYCQSDEISLVLVDYQRFETSAWFDYEVQKMCSIAASMATMAFNKQFKQNIDEWKSEMLAAPIEFNAYIEKKIIEDQYEIYKKAYEKGAMFDARVFNIPKEEVTNYVYWRQLDCSRNSIQMAGQANFSHKELQNKSCNDIQDMLMIQKGINWNDFPVYQKRGSCVIRSDEDERITEPNIYNEEVIGTKTTIRRKWVIDKDIPIFKGEGRDYIEQLINVGE